MKLSLVLFIVGVLTGCAGLPPVTPPGVYRQETKTVSPSGQTTTTTFIWVHPEPLWCCVGPMYGPPIIIRFGGHHH